MQFLRTWQLPVASSIFEWLSNVLDPFDDGSLLCLIGRTGIELRESGLSGRGQRGRRRRIGGQAAQAGGDQILATFFVVRLAAFPVTQTPGQHGHDDD